MQVQILINIKNKNMKFLKSFYQKKGWLHLVTILCVLYCIMVWGCSSYAQNTQYFPSSMLASFVRQTILFQSIMVLFIGFAIGYIIEWVEKKFFNAEWEWFDVIWTTIGSPLGWILFWILPNKLTIVFSYYLTIVFWEILKSFYYKFKK